MDTSLLVLSETLAQTLVGKLRKSTAKFHGGISKALWGITALCFSQSIQAQELQPIDLRIEIDSSIYSSTLCQKIVALHASREDAPWGLIFAKPSHLCTYPEVFSKAYTLNMWRLVVSELQHGLRFSICRPVPQGGRLSEHCTWSISVKKQRKWREELLTDQFLFLMISGLHEQLPFRDFNARGEELSRPEPRMKSEKLENPPPLVRGRLTLDRVSGRMLFSPFNRSTSDRTENSVPESFLWWLQKEDKSSRLAAFDELLEEEGYVVLPRSETNNETATEKNRVQLTEQNSAPKNTSAAQNKKEPDETGDQDLFSLQGFFTPFWNGVWQSKLTLNSLPIPESMTDRLPSMMAGTLELRHPLWGGLSTGIQAGYSMEKESAQLRVNTSLTGQQQLALGKRSTSLLGAQLDLGFQCFTPMSCRIGAASGYGGLKTTWDYDRESTTLAVWAPGGQGIYIQPWISIEPLSPSEEGPTAQLSYFRQKFNGGLTSTLTLEGGWHWRPRWALADWGALTLDYWKTSIGYKTGTMTKSDPATSGETGTNTSLTSVWFGIQAGLSEVVQ